MPRKRSIKPGFFMNEQLGECSMAARLLFAGLWCWADREGRLEDRPRMLKASILPYDDVDADALLADLALRELIVRYEVDGKRYIHIATFAEHQSPHPHEAASVIPSPPNVITGSLHAETSNGMQETSPPLALTSISNLAVADSAHARKTPSEPVDSSSSKVCRALTVDAVPAAVEIVEEAVRAYPDLPHVLKATEFRERKGRGFSRMSPVERATGYANYLDGAARIRREQQQHPENGARASPDPPPRLPDTTNDPERDAEVDRFYEAHGLTDEHKQRFTHHK